ncbi:MAG: hypothetical protein BWY65_02318 [Firmicutes bacterium ADurb.Bin373]|nr:MAG: hypothetical protein BWY65_02318 [Firmicutes bacterium ADurb.Bin373]
MPLTASISGSCAAGMPWDVSKENEGSNSAGYTRKNRTAPRSVSTIGSSQAST